MIVRVTLQLWRPQQVAVEVPKLFNGRKSANQFQILVVIMKCLLFARCASTEPACVRVLQSVFSRGYLKLWLETNDNDYYNFRAEVEILFSKMDIGLVVCVCTRAIHTIENYCKRELNWDIPKPCCLWETRLSIWEHFPLRQSRLRSSGWNISTNL